MVVALVGVAAFLTAAVVSAAFFGLSQKEVREVAVPTSSQPAAESPWIELSQRAIDRYDLDSFDEVSAYIGDDLKDRIAAANFLERNSRSYPMDEFSTVRDYAVAQREAALMYITCPADCDALLDLAVLSTNNFAKAANLAADGIAPPALPGH